MKYLILTLLLIIPDYTRLMEEQTDRVESRVYSWPQELEEVAPGVWSADVLSGNTTALTSLTVSARQLHPGTSEVGGGTMERLVIVKSGVLTITHQGKPIDLVPGSAYVSFAKHGVSLANNQAEPVEFFMFSYASRQGVDDERGLEAGGAYVVDWDKLEVRETRRGEHRHYFDGPTSSLSRFEMHVTTLNEGLTSHDVHTHREEEFLLIISGEVEEHIDGSNHRASVGDLIFLDSMVPHTITNVGEESAQYFAFKWE